MLGMDPSAAAATAYHEAGHAVMALALGRPVGDVSAVPDRDYLGTCELRKPPGRGPADWFEQEILIALAGLAAEAIHTGDYAWSAAERDFRYVRSLTLKRTGNERRAERLERRLLAKAEHLLAKGGHWRSVERIARELLRCGSISGRAAAGRRGRCSRNRPDRSADGPPGNDRSSPVSSPRRTKCP
jgi:hypothetical protein